MPPPLLTPVVGAPLPWATRVPGTTIVRLSNTLIIIPCFILRSHRIAWTYLHPVRRPLNKAGNSRRLWEERRVEQQWSGGGAHGLGKNNSYLVGRRGGKGREEPHTQSHAYTHEHTHTHFYECPRPSSLVPGNNVCSRRFFSAREFSLGGALTSNAFATFSSSISSNRSHRTRMSVCLYVCTII